MDRNEDMTHCSKRIKREVNACLSKEEKKKGECFVMEIVNVLMVQICNRGLPYIWVLELNASVALDDPKQMG